jgi:hypothetical protein
MWLGLQPKSGNPCRLPLYQREVINGNDMPDLTLYDRICAGLVKVNRLSSPEMRFWSRLDKNGPKHPVVGICWKWTSTKDRRGYARMKIAGCSPLAHRYSWTLHYGAIPDGLHVLHRCDNPGCVNPHHLFLGSDRDNAADMVSKNRQAKGIRHPKAKLTEEQVKEIRTRYRNRDNGCTLRSLAWEYGLTCAAIHAVVHEYHWKDVPSEQIPIWDRE